MKAICFAIALSFFLSPERSHASSSGDSDDSRDPRSSAPPQDELMCGCSECTTDVLSRMAGDFQCGDRIMSLMEGVHQLSEEEACIRVARTEFYQTCGPECDPGRCDGRSLPGTEMPSTYCGCKHCDHDVWQRVVDQYTCGSRISYLTDFDGLPTPEACNIVGGVEFPEDDLCGLCDPARCEPVHGSRNGERCGCSRCIDAVWNLDADGFTCGERIEYLLTLPDEYPTELDACRQVAQVEFPDRCGSNCAPDYCDAPLTARTDLYCFPIFHNRTRFRNVFGEYTVEVKESPEGDVCGPSNNKFTNTTVDRLDRNELKLQFKKEGDHWIGSEIRLRLPEDEMPFSYGTYSFSVKSVEVIDSNTDAIVDEKLPQSLVFSMFTYDATENFAIHENFNHQVSVDLSRNDLEAGPDARFTVHPVGYPLNTFEFYTGDDGDYQQPRRIYKFDWRPAEVEFYSDAGEEVSYSYSTQRALEAGEPDFVQCMPADVEIRMNLWNIYGTLPPTGLAMQDSYVVEVVIDDFTYAPSGLDSVLDGGACSRDCHCGDSSKCFNNVCTQVMASYDLYYGESLNQGRMNNAQKESVPTRVAAGFALFGGAMVAAALIVVRRIRKARKRPTPRVVTPEFDLSSTAAVS